MLFTIPLPNGESLVGDVEPTIRAVDPPREALPPCYQALWKGVPFCVGYGPSAKQAIERLRVDTAMRFLEPEPAPVDGAPSTALEAWRWVQETFRRVVQG